MATNTIAERFAINRNLVVIDRLVHLRFAPFLEVLAHLELREERHIFAIDKEVAVRHKRIFVRHVAAQHNAVQARTNLGRIELQRICAIRHKHFALVLVVHLVIAGNRFREALVHDNHAVRFFAHHEVLRIMRHALLRDNLVNG